MLNATFVSTFTTHVFGMHMWHLPSLPHICSSVFTSLRHICQDGKFVQIHFFVQATLALSPRAALSNSVCNYFYSYNFSLI